MTPVRDPPMHCTVPQNKYSHSPETHWNAQGFLSLILSTFFPSQLSSVVTLALRVMAEYIVWMEQHFLTLSSTRAWTATCSLVPPPGNVRPTGHGRAYNPTVPVS